MSKGAHIFWRMVISFVVFFSPALSSAQEVVQVRSADHPTFSRIVFDWQEMVPYTALLTEDRLEITFEKASIPNWNGLPNEPLKYLADPEYRRDGDKLKVSLKVTRPGRLEHFRYGTKIVFDVSGRDGAAAAAEVPPEAFADIETAARGPLDTALENAVETKPVSDSGDLKLRVSRRWDSTRLRYPWQQNVKAAVFVRDNHLWVVFEGKRVVDQGELIRFIGERVLSACQIDHPSMTVLMYELVPGQHVKAQRIDTEWYIDLKNSSAAPELEIPIGHPRMASDKGESFFYSVENAGSILVVEDPVIGDELAIVPVLESSRGVLQTQKFAEFKSLATAQGIAVQLIADDLNIVKYPSGISVTAQDGLVISRNQLADKLGLAAGGGRNEKLIDFPSWARGPLAGKGYYKNKHELLYLLSNSIDTDRIEMRWRLARFYLANGHKREAYGVLSVMLDDVPKLIDNPKFRAVLGVTNILIRRFEEGANLLDHKTLDANKEALLWRAVAHSELGDYKLAFENYKKGSDILSLYDPHDRVRFMFAAVRSAYELGDKDFVEFALSLLEKLPLNASQMTKVEYWRALLERDGGNPFKAVETLQGIVKAGVRETAAWAKLALIDLDYKNKKIDAAEAVDQLEKLRFAWRGDDFELELLARLGDLYVEQKEYNTGLQTLKLAVTFFGESKKTAMLTRQMSRIYNDLFLKGGADAMEPVKAVALYSEFRELIPLGQDGDKMTRRLADRLVSIDLLEEAAELLKHQINFRLKGGAQAVVATRLAMIYLLDSKPEEALRILRATRDSQTPDDIEDRRRMIETRALIELGRFEEAEVLIENYNNAEAESLRADIYWKSKNWDKYISHGNRMLGKRYQDDRELSEEERLAVLRLSVAYVINGDKAGVRALRDKYKALMDNGLYGDTFEVITAERQLTDLNVHRLTSSIASVAKLETFMDSYRAEFTSGLAQN